MIANITNSDVTNSDKKLLLQSLRQLTIEQKNDIYYQFAHNETILEKLSNMLKDDTISIDCISEVLWILTNLSCEPQICSYLIEELEVIKTIEILFKHYFVKDTTTDTVEPLSQELVNLME